jgi:NAD(P)-dependent dehydrogenase (short-subunit alcohol dehydrogenase family)
MRLKDKRVVITAAASGMGRAGCEIFAREGATVFAVDIDETRLNEVVAAIKKTGAEAYGLVVDLLNPDTCRRVVDDAALRMGGLDIIWNHASIPGLREVEHLDLAAYARTMDMNVRTGLVMTSAAIPHLRQRGGGSVVFTASMPAWSALHPV